MKSVTIFSKLKRAIPILFGAVGISLALIVVLQSDPAVQSDVFQARLSGTFLRNGFTAVSAKTVNSDHVALPHSVRWHPRHWYRKISVMTGFPDRAEHYTVTRDGSAMIDCFVRYIDDRASFIEIKTTTPQRLVAMDMQSALDQQFPGLPIKLTAE